MPKGGKRPGAGRRPVSVEMKARELCIAGLVRKFGSLELAIDDLCASKDPILRRFVLEHAIGKPQEKVEVSNKKYTVRHEE